MSKVTILNIAALFIAITVTGQVGISDTGSFSPDDKAVFDLRSTSKGLLIPRMTTGQISAIENPPDGLMIYNTETHTLFIFNGQAGSWGNLVTGDISFVPGGCGLPITDARDGKVYNTVLIGNVCWMKQNLNVGNVINSTVAQTNNGIIEKYCYANNSANCTAYGGMYRWGEMMQYTTDTAVRGICPEGWHLPTDYEWKVLEGTVDGIFGVGDPTWEQTGYRGYNAGKNLKSTTGWNSGTGIDAYGFHAIPGGYCNLDGNFSGIGDQVIYWNSKQDATGFLGWRRMIHSSNDGIHRSNTDKNWAFYVRCVKD